MGRWKRPDSVPFPSIWTRFEGRKKINGVIPKFWVQDIPDDLHETIAKYMVDGFLADEPISRYTNIKLDEESNKVMYDMWMDVLKDRLGLVCFMENPDPNGKPIIAGMNCTHLVFKDDHFSVERTTEKCDKIFQTLEYISKVKDAFEILEINEAMGAMGLFVLPEFRGQNLGYEILKARIPLGKAVGLKATLTVFTATASQILGDRLGFKNVAIMSYAELEQKNPTFKYPGIKNHTENIAYKYLIF